MKRFLIGAALLASLFLGGLLISFTFGRTFEPMADGLVLASQAARDENWPQARELTRHIRQQWSSRWGLTAVFSDHEPMEQVEGLFAQLEIYGSKRQGPAFAALCEKLAQMLTDLGEEHIFTWWNFL